MSDLRFAFRSLLKSPGFTLVAVLTLALAIGSNTAIFGLVHDLALKPLAPAPVVNIFHGQAAANPDYRSFSWAEMESLREANEVFSEVGAVDFSLAGIGIDGQDVRRAFTYFGTANIFTMFDVQPVIGRFFNSAESAPGSNIAVTVINESLYQRLGGSPDLIGSLLRINNRPYTVIGVSPRDFSVGNALIAPEVWMPFGMHGSFSAPFGDDENLLLNDPLNHPLVLLARLQPGLDLNSAKPRLTSLEQRLNAIDTDPAPQGRFLEIQSPSRFSISDAPSDDGPVSLIATLLLAMSGIVLIIACLNLANMLLARGASRRREIAVRIALGASRWQIIRQLLVEGILLSLAGGVAGLILSLWTTDLILHSLSQGFITMSFSLAMEATPSFPLLAATFIFCLIATLLFCLLPALKFSRPDLVEDLKSQAQGQSGTSRWNRFFSPRHCLIMAQIALSLVLIFSAGLFARGAYNAGNLDLGFNQNDSVLTEFDYSLSRIDPLTAQRTLLEMREKFLAHPEVSAAAISNLVPYGQVSSSTRIVRSDTSAPISADPDAPAPGFNGIVTSISAGYFDTIEVKLLRGRDFTVTETNDGAAPPVVIVDQRMAESLFPDENALGQRVRLTAPLTTGRAAEFEIVGICAPFRHDVLSDTAPRRIYFPFAQRPSVNAFLHVRGQGNGRDAVFAMLPFVRNLIREIDRSAPLLMVVPLADFVDKNIGLWITRLGAIMFGVFGGLALVLAVIGVYGVKAYSIACRTREIGIRMALGARSKDVFALIMNQATQQTFVGLGCGLLLALGAGQLLSRMLFRVDGFDPLILFVAALILALATLGACFLPARRATLINPMVAMRTD